MKLKITVGRDLQNLPRSQDLKILYQSPHLVLEGSSGILSTQAGERQAFLVGRLTGHWNPIRLAHVIGRESLEDCRKILEGSYILVLLEADGSCQIATDCFGKRELFYQTEGEQTFFATDLSLLPISLRGGAFDQEALMFTLCVYGCRPPKKHTLYRDVRRLGFDEKVLVRRGEIEFIPIPFQPLATADYGEQELDQYANLFLDAVQSRGSEKGNVVYLSSGWDSTALLACLVKLYGREKVRVVTGRMQYSERGGVINQLEIDRAKAFADYFKVRLDIVDFDYRRERPPLFDDLLPVLRSHQMASLPALNHEVLADFVQQTTPGDEAIFAGEISDGVHNLGFSQFITFFHPVQSFREYGDKMASYLFGPSFLKQILSGQYTTDPVYRMLRGRLGDDLFDLPEKGAGLCRQLLASFFMRSNRIPFWSLKNHRLLTEDGRKLFQDHLEKSYLNQVAERLTPETLYSWYLHLYNSFHWQGSTIASLDLTAREKGLRMELPFWDRRLHEFLAQMPESWGRGLDLNPTKYPLKWSLKNRLNYPMHLQSGPHAYIYDVDPSFNLGAEILYRSAFTPYFREILKKRPYQSLLDQNYFDFAYIDGMVDRYLVGIEAMGIERNELLNLCQLTAVGWYGI